jgi:hypothetical protein
VARGSDRADQPALGASITGTLLAARHIGILSAAVGLICADPRYVVRVDQRPCSLKFLQLLPTAVLAGRLVSEDQVYVISMDLLLFR